MARTTGADPVPTWKATAYRTGLDKFALAGLTPKPAETVAPSQLQGTIVQPEAVLEAHHSLADEDEALRGRLLTLEVRVKRVHLAEDILLTSYSNRVDPDKWGPFIMSFQHFYGLGPRVHGGPLARIPEALYRSADIDRARLVE